jgi:hypothetical protein
MGGGWSWLVGGTGCGIVSGRDGAEIYIVVGAIIASYDVGWPEAVQAWVAWMTGSKAFRNLRRSRRGAFARQLDPLDAGGHPDGSSGSEASVSRAVSMPDGLLAPILGQPAGVSALRTARLQGNAAMARLLRDGAAAPGRASIPSGPGSELPEAVRTRFEAAFGRDLSHVRIHSDGAAASASEALNAEAFAVEDHIYFGRGRYEPGTSGGDRLLAHELTHVVQADEGRLPSGGGVSHPSDPAEREAYANEARIVSALPSPAMVEGGAAPQGGDGEQGAPSGGLVLPAQGSEVPAAQGSVIEADVCGADEVATACDEGDGLVPEIDAPETTHPERPATATVTGVVDGMAAGPRTVAPAPRTTPPPVRAMTVEGQTPVVSQGPDAGSMWPGDELGAGLTGHALEAAEVVFPSQIASAGDGTGARLRHEAQRAAEAVRATTERLRQSLGEDFRQQIDLVVTARAEALAGIFANRDANAVEVQRHGQAAALAAEGQVKAQRAENEALVLLLQQELFAAGSAQAARALEGTATRVAAVQASAGSVRGEGDGPRAQAQRDAAQRIARDTVKELQISGQEMVADVQDEAHGQASDYGEQLAGLMNNYDRVASMVRQQVEEGTNAAVERIYLLAQQAADGVTSLADHAVLAIEGRAEAADQALAAQGQEEHGAILAAGDSLAEQLRPRAAALDAAYEDAVASALAEVEDIKDDATRKEARVEVWSRARYDHAAALAALVEAENEMSAGVVDARTTALERLEALCDRRQQEAAAVASEFVVDLGCASREASDELRNTAQQATVGMSLAVDETVNEVVAEAFAFRATLQSSHAGALDSLGLYVETGLSEQDRLVATARGEMVNAAQAVGGRYDELKAEAQHRSDAEQETASTRVQRSWLGAVGAFFSDLSEGARQWFQEKLGDFWGGLIFGILAGVLMIAVGALAVYLIGALIASAVVAIKVIGVLLAVAAVVTVLYLAITARFEEYKSAHDGQDAGGLTAVGLFFLGIADLSGVPYVVEAVVGQTATGLELDGFDRWERLGTGLVFTVAIFGSFARGLLRGRGGARIREGEAGGSEPLVRIEKPAGEQQGGPGTTRTSAEQLAKNSEGRQGPGSNTGHAMDHIPGEGVDPLVLVRARPTKPLTTVWRNARHAYQVLRDILNKHRKEIDALVAGDPNSSVGGAHTVSPSRPGYVSRFGGEPTPVEIGQVSFRIVRLANGELHLVHFSPQAR